MNAPVMDNDAPLSPEAERVRKRVVRLMAVSVGIMMVSLLAVFGAVYYKFVALADKNKPVANVTQTASGSNTIVPVGVGADKDIVGRIELPTGAKISSTTYAQGRVVLQLELADGNGALWIYDLAANRVFAKIALER